MAINDDPFQEAGHKKPEKKNDTLESFDAEPSDDEEIELSDILDASDDEEILELEEALDTVSEDRDVLDLGEAQTVKPDDDDDVIELAMVVETNEDEEILDLTDEMTEPSLEDGDDIVDLTEHSETPASEIENVVTTESTGPADATDEDKEIMELIDDIQASLDDKEPPEADAEPLEADTDQISSEEDAGDGMAAAEEDGQEPIILGDEESLETAEISDSESDFVDHLGLDLTSEFSKEIFGEGAKENLASADPAQLEEIIDRTVRKMLSDKNSPLMQAISRAVKKEIENKTM